jgi:small subunit ribosomal protein S11
MSGIKVKTKKNKKHVSLAVIHVKVTFNNTIVTFTDVQGDTLISYSSGRAKFKGTRKATPHAAQVSVKQASDLAKDEYDVKTVSVYVQGPGSQRESALRAIFEQGFVVTKITDVSPVAHNGCKPRKARRV